MAFTSSQSTRILHGAVAIASTVRNATPSFSQQMIDVTTIGDTFKSFVGGISEWSFKVDGVFDNATTAGSAHAAMNSPLSASDTVAVSVAPTGFSAGSAVWVFPAKEVTYEVMSQVDGAVEYSIAYGAGTAPAIGVSLADLASVTTTSNGTSQDNTAATANGFVAQLHITAVSGTTPSLTAVVQQSTNNSTWTTLGTFTAATAVGSQTITGTGTVNRYLRIAWTVSGTTPSFTVQASVARY